MKYLQRQTNYHSSHTREKYLCPKNFRKLYKKVSRTFVSMSSKSYIMLILLMVLCTTPYTVSSRGNDNYPEQRLSHTNRHNSNRNNISKHKHHSSSHIKKGKKSNEVFIKIS